MVRAVRPRDSTHSILAGYKESLCCNTYRSLKRLARAQLETTLGTAT